jgi:hypothetical protein
MACEEERTRLIGQIASLLKDRSLPEEARTAGLTLIGWLARRMPGEKPHDIGVEEIRRRCAHVNGASTSNGAIANGMTPANGASSHAEASARSRGNGRSEK